MFWIKFPHLVFRFPSLYGLLKKLQSTESESHLCVQYPDLEGHSGSIQEKVSVVDNKFCVPEKSQKPKETNIYTFYLRVHLNMTVFVENNVVLS